MASQATVAHRRYWLPALNMAAVLACASPQVPDPDVVRPAPGAPFLDRLPGPLLVFDSSQSALIAACQKIVTKPNAVAGRPQQQGFGSRWRASKEYCAWIYYTPDDKYVLSKLTDQTSAAPTEQVKNCVLPSYVDDQRFPPESIKYIYSLHNHLFDDMLSKFDLIAIVMDGAKHGFKADTKEGVMRLSIIAFFSNDVEHPRCDGFYQYIPIDGRVLKWTLTDFWTCTQTQRVTWDAAFEEPHFTQANAPCFGESHP